MASLLVVDDEPSLRELLEIMFRKQRHEVATVATLAAAMERIAGDEYDLVVSDLRLGAESGLTLLESVKGRFPATEVVMMTAFATTENAIQAMKLGAYDYVLKPFKLEEMQLIVEKALEHRRLVAENRVLRHRVGERAAEPPVILGRAPEMVQVRELVAKVGPTRSTVLISGESGTGKEVVARAIHAAGDRRDLPFVAVNCGAIPEGLIESEFFGHEKGAFTGAGERRAGLFEVAGAGTLFLDEIGELPPPVQVKLLRALQERRIRRVGGTADLGISARIVAATNRELAEDVRAGRFREDLFYRLCVVPITVPPLRRRRGDVRTLAEAFLARAAPRGVSLRWGEEALAKLEGYDWPGNVRQLKNVVQRALLFRGEGLSVPAGAVTFEDTRLSMSDGVDADTIYARGLTLDEIEREAIRLSLRRNHGKRAAVVKELRIAKSTVLKRIGQWGLHDEGRVSGEPRDLEDED